MRLDPDNRLVADSLEAEWNEKLRALTQAQEEAERERQADRVLIDKDQRARILCLATDLPRLWRDPATPAREKKRMLRLLVEDVTLLKGKELTAHVRFRGGAAKTLSLPRPLPAWKFRETSPEVIAEIDALLEEHTDNEIVRIMTERGFRSGEGKPINSAMVYRLRREHGIKDRYERLRRRGMLTLKQMAKALDVDVNTIKVWRRHGLLRAHAYNDKNQYLYEAPGPDAPKKHKRKFQSSSAHISTSRA